MYYKYMELLRNFLFSLATFLGIIVTSPKISSRPINLILTGDIMLGRTVMTTSFDKSDPIYPFRYVADTLKSADLVFSNLENPVIEKCPRKTTGMIFCADPEMLLGLNYAGVDVVTLANNHSRNYGQKGLDETIQQVENQGIKVTGNNNLVVKMIDDTKFGFLGFEKSQQSNPGKGFNKKVRQGSRCFDYRNALGGGVP
jgi:poly-gamma-glutamate synthesis protein (capsule biosynthesis protein)